MHIIYALLGLGTIQARIPKLKMGGARRKKILQARTSIGIEFKFLQ